MDIKSIGLDMALRKLDEVTAQRDELLAALNHLVYEEGNRYFVGWRDDTDVTEYVSDAIAKCEVQS